MRDGGERGLTNFLKKRFHNDTDRTCSSSNGSIATGVHTEVVNRCLDDSNDPNSAVARRAQSPISRA